jgi:hypothetical protein
VTGFLEAVLDADLPAVFAVTKDLLVNMAHLDLAICPNTTGILPNTQEELLRPMLLTTFLAPAECRQRRRFL